MLVALAAAAPVAHADSREASLFEAPRELMSDDAALRAKTLDEIQGFGVSWVRVVLYWRNVAPNPADWRVPAVDLSDPGAYDCGRYDRAIDELQGKFKGGMAIDEAKKIRATVSTKSEV